MLGAGVKLPLQMLASYNGIPGFKCQLCLHAAFQLMISWDAASDNSSNEVPDICVGDWDQAFNLAQSEILLVFGNVFEVRE